MRKKTLLISMNRKKSCSQPLQELLDKNAVYGYGVFCLDAGEHAVGRGAHARDGVQSLRGAHISLSLHLEFGALGLRVRDLARRGEQTPLGPSRIPKLAGCHGVHVDVDHARIGTRHATMASNFKASLRVLHAGLWAWCHFAQLLAHVKGQVKKSKNPPSNAVVKFSSL
jgi:hypothetical protein